MESSSLSPIGLCRRPRLVSSFELAQGPSESILPTVFRSGPYRFFFYMADRHERPHVHVVRDDREAKLWLDPVNIARAGSFSPVELRRIERIIEENRYTLLEHWDASFGV